MSGLKNVTDANFKAEVLDSQGAVLVDFWAPWCGPCRMMAPELDKLAGEMAGKLKVVKLNTDENMQTASQYQITGIPCLILFKGGSEKQRFVGFQPGDALSKQLEDIV